jgi:hypothetical protein
MFMLLPVVMFGTCPPILQVIIKWGVGGSVSLYSSWDETKHLTYVISKCHRDLECGTGNREGGIYCSNDTTFFPTVITALNVCTSLVLVMFLVCALRSFVASHNVSKTHNLVPVTLIM